MTPARVVAEVPASRWWAVLMPLLVVAMVSALLFLAASRRADQPLATATATAVPVTGAAASCPALSAGAPDDPTALNVAARPAAAPGLAVVSAGGPPGDAGTVEVRDRGSGVTLRPADRGAWRTLPGPATGLGGDLVIRPGVAAAPGFAAFALSRPTQPSGGGLAVTACRPLVPSAPSSTWFVGLGSSTGHASVVVLSNPGGTDAVADLDLYDSTGPLDPVGAAGVVVAAGTSVRLPLARLVAGRDELAVHVRTSQGQLVAAAQDSWSGPSALGTEWLAPTSEPSTSLVLTGTGSVPTATVRDVTLVVVNPGASTANVRVEVTSRDGTVVPVGADRVEVPPSSTATLRLPDAQGADVDAVRLGSSVPVTASARLSTTAGGGDVAYAVAGPALAGAAAAVVPLSLPDAPGATPVPLRPTLVLVGADPDRASVAVVEAVDADGRSLGRRLVEVPAGRSRRVVATGVEGGRAAAYVLVGFERGGPLHVAWSSPGSGDVRGLSVVPVTGLVQTVAVPALRLAP